MASSGDNPPRLVEEATAQPHQQASTAHGVAVLSSGVSVPGPQSPLSRVVNPEPLAAAEFPHFVKLPSELQWQVWEHFCPDLSSSRVLNFMFQQCLQDLSEVSLCNTYYCLAEQTACARTLASISSDTRSLALRAFPDTLVFGGGGGGDNGGVAAAATAAAGAVVIRFSGERDVFRLLTERRDERFFVEDSSVRSRGDLHTLNVRHVAVQRWQPGWTMGGGFDNYASLLTAFPRMETLFVEFRVWDHCKDHIIPARGSAAENENEALVPGPSSPIVIQALPPKMTAGVWRPEPDVRAWPDPRRRAAYVATENPTLKVFGGRTLEWVAEVVGVTAWELVSGRKADRGGTGGGLPSTPITPAMPVTPMTPMTLAIPMTSRPRHRREITVLPMAHCQWDYRPGMRFSIEDRIGPE